MLSALQKLGEILSPTEMQFLEAHASTVMKNFDVVSDEKGLYFNVEPYFINLIHTITHFTNQKVHKMKQFF